MARVTEESLMGQIRSLNPGQTVSRTRRITLGKPEEPSPADALAKLRNLLNQAVGRLRKEEPGSNFRVESGSAITADQKAILATVAVTRFNADDPNGDDEEADI